jgi:hypothetical protein
MTGVGLEPTTYGLKVTAEGERLKGVAELPSDSSCPSTISRSTKSWTRAYVVVTPASDAQTRGSIVQLVLFYPASTLPREPGV